MYTRACTCIYTISPSAPRSPHTVHAACTRPWRYLSGVRERQREQQPRERGRLKIFARTFARGSVAISARYLAFPQTRQVCETADISLPSPSRTPFLSSSRYVYLFRLSVLSLISLPWSVMSLTLIQPRIRRSFVRYRITFSSDNDNRLTSRERNILYVGERECSIAVCWE